MESIQKFVSLAAAMEQLGSSDEKTFVAEAKKHECYFERGGIARIDLASMELAVDASFEAMQERRSKRKTAVRNIGADLGLVQARITMYPRRISSKEDKISLVENALRAAVVPYDRVKLARELDRLRGELTSMKAGYERDLKRRDSIIRDESEPLTN